MIVKWSNIFQPAKAGVCRSTLKKSRGFEAVVLPPFKSSAFYKARLLVK